MHMRRVILAGVVALTGGVLAGCEQPPPGITVFSGTGSVRTAALCWSFDNQPLASGQCARDIISGAEIGDAPELSVAAGNTVGISVDTAVAAAGWVPAVAGQRLVSRPITDTYFRFTFPQGQLPQQGIGLQVLAGGNNDLKGVWAVRLVD